MGFEDVVVHDVSGDHIQNIQLHPTKKNLVIISLQDAVTGEVEEGKEWAKIKFSALEGVLWDAGILDEVHHGQETLRAIAVKSRIQCQRWLALSATPWKNIALGRFDRHNTHEWSIVDEGVAKAGNPKVYGKYPAMNFYLWEIDDKIRKELKEDYSEEQYPTMKKLFRAENGKLVHENLVRKIFQNWIRKITEHDINPQNILAFLPDTSFLEPLADLLRDIFSDLYEVGYTHSKNNPNAADVLAFRENLYAKAKSKGKGTIILAVGQLTTGVTLKQCDCILHLDDAISTSAYIQKSLRSQNPGDRKDNCYIFDFNPNRALKCILSTALGTRLHKPIVERVHDFLLNAAVQMISEGKWTEIDSEYLIRCGVEAQLTINRNLFNRGIINSDVLANMDETELYKQLVELPYIEQVVNKHTDKPTPLDPNGSGPGENKIITGVIPVGDVTELEEIPIVPIVITPTNTEPIEQKPILTMEQKLERLMSNLCWLPAITKFKFVTIEEIIEYLNSHDEERKEFEALISKIDEKTIFPIPFSYVKKLLNHKDKDGRYLVDRDEINKRLYCLVIDCKNDPGKANELMISEDQYKKIFGEVFTPAELVNEMLDKLPAEVWGNKDLTWCDPACGSGNFLYQTKIRLMDGLKDVIEDEKDREKWIVEKMLFGVELQRKNSYLCMFKLDPNDEFNVNVACEDSLKFDFWGKKFDIVVGNPPYQDEQKGKGKLGSKPLWIRFVNLTLDSLLADGGYLCFVHPSKWRKYEDELWEKMTSRQILHLDIHSYNDGQKTFGAATRYDWYVLKNIHYHTSTSVRDEEGKLSSIDIREWNFLPNFAFDEIKAILATTGPNVEILHSHSIYEIRKDFMSKTPTTENVFPCVYSVNRKNQPTFYYSQHNKAHIGTPKVIFGSGATGFLVDANGEYGMTQFATGIIDDVENLPKIAQVLDSQPFKRIVQATSMSKAELDRKILGLFRKDF